MRLTSFSTISIAVKRLSVLALYAAATCVGACGAGKNGAGSGGSGGSAGSAGSGTSSATGGAAGSTPGSGGSSATGGAAGSPEGAGGAGGVSGSSAGTGGTGAGGSAGTGGTASAGGAGGSGGMSVTENFKDGKFDLASYMGSKVKVVSDGEGGPGDGSLMTTFDGNGQAPYVTAMTVPAAMRGKVLYLSYDIKVSNGSAYETWAPKHLKFLATNSSTGCYWHTTDRWDIVMYGANNSCARDAQNNVQTKDSTANSRTGPVTITVQPNPAFHFQDNTWYHWKVMVKANDLGKQNGEIEEWLNGAVYWDIQNMSLRDASMDWYVDTIDFGGYTSGNPGVTVYMWLDNITLSNVP